MPSPTSEQAADKVRETMTLAHIGAFIVAMGNLESAICRLVEWLQGNPNPGEIATAQGLSWKRLIDVMRTEARVQGIGDKVHELTEQHNLSRLVSLRHSLSHSAVRVTPDLVLINRRPPNGDDQMILVWTDTLRSETSSVNALTGALDALLPETYRRVTANLAAGVVGLTRERARDQGIDPDVPI